MISFNEFQKITDCQIVGSRLISRINGKNVDVGITSGSGFVPNKTGDKLVADYASAVAAELEGVARDANEENVVLDRAVVQTVVPEAEKTFTDRFVEKTAAKKIVKKV